MDQQFINEQESALLKEKTRLENQIKNLKKYPDYGYSEEDNIQELIDYENNMSAEEQLNFLLNKINQALLAIKKGTYGKCAACGKAIEEDRLKIMPYAELCVNCKPKKD